MSPNAAEEYTILSSHGPGTSLSALIHRAYPSEQPPVKFRNVGERFALVLSGSVRFTFNGDVVELKNGDSAHFASQTPYSMEITSNGPAEILWFVSPAIV
jgi:quercetin dioxygenase-like cupin family protein